MNFLPTHYSHLILLCVFGLLFHSLLWARNGRYLWSQRRLIAKIIVIGEIWMVITDPIGGHWGAWIFDPTRVLGIWFLGVMPLEDFLGAAIVSSAAACGVLVFGYGPRRWI